MYKRQELKVGEAIHVDDLDAIDGVEFLNNGVQVIVSCQPPTVAAVAEPETTESDAAAAEDAGGNEASAASDSSEAAADGADSSDA